MTRTAIGLVATAALLGACARATAPAMPTPAAPALPVLAWTVNGPVVATYQLSDTSKVSVQAGPAGNVDVDIVMNGSVEMRIEPNGDSVRVTAQMTAFDGSFKNSMGGPAIAIGKDDVAGTAILSIGPRGDLNVVQRVEGSARLRQIGSIEALYRNFVVRLPAKAARPGATWSDTIRASDAREGVTSSIRTIVSSTYAGDSTVNGRTLRVIRATASNELEISGTSQGVQLVQKMTGTSDILTLWDADRRLIVERSETGSLSGSMDMPSMGMSGLPLRATNRRRYVLTSP